MAVAGVADADTLKTLAAKADPAARLVACLAMRRHGDAAIAGLLDDADPRIVLEAARAIHDVPSPAATAAAQICREPLLAPASSSAATNTSAKFMLPPAGPNAAPAPAGRHSPGQTRPWGRRC